MRNRYSRWLLCAGLWSALGVSAAGAQPAQMSPKEIGQIVDVALQATVPPTHRLTTHTVKERGIRLDYGRTLAAFGHRDDPRTRATLGLSRAVTPGSESLLADCDQLGTKACRQLGLSAYVYVEPISTTSSEAAVWVHVIWATTPTKRSYQSAESTEVILSRSATGRWVIARIGRRVVS